LALKHFDFNCHLDFGIWNLSNGIATHFSPVVARHDSAEAIPVCPPVIARRVAPKQSRPNAYVIARSVAPKQSRPNAYVIARLTKSAEAIPAG